jgi:hypothetical protein
MTARSFRSPTSRFTSRERWRFSNGLHNIAVLAKSDSTVLVHVTHFSGSYNYRPIRGSTRLSVHAFEATLDFDAENQPMTYAHCYEKNQPHGRKPIEIC